MSHAYMQRKEAPRLSGCFLPSLLFNQLTFNPLVHQATREKVRGVPFIHSLILSPKLWLFPIHSFIDSSTKALLTLPFLIMWIRGERGLGLPPSGRFQAKGVSNENQTVLSATKFKN